MLTYLGGVYGVLADQQRSRDVFEQALALKRNHFGETHVQTTRARVQLARVYGELGLKGPAYDLYCAGLDAAHLEFPGDRTLRQLIQGSMELEDSR